MAKSRVIWVEPQAPAKPPVGQACNGCGICCLSEPCPLGMLLSRRRTGACAVLRWDEPKGRYVCTAVSDMPAMLRRYAPWLGVWARGRLAGGLSRLARRWIASGSGCDCSSEAQPSTALLGDNDMHD
ncbi:MAG: hypothetical protein OEY75_01105 [Hylemonella sp.]|nr:hypothetical protein [Hylemonella sp.]